MTFASVGTVFSLSSSSSSSFFLPACVSTRRQAVVVQERLVGGRRRRRWCEQLRQQRLSERRLSRRRQNVVAVPAQGPVQVGHQVRGRQTEKEEEIVGRVVLVRQQRVPSVHTKHHQAVHAQQRPVAVV